MIIARAAGQLVIAQIAKDNPASVTALQGIGFIRTNNERLADDVLNFAIGGINIDIFKGITNMI